MPKQKTEVVFTSLKDMGAKQAAYRDRGAAFALYAMEQGITSESITDEQKAELYAGYQVQYGVNNPPKQYVKSGDGTAYLPVTDSKNLPKGDIVTFSIDVAMGYTTSAYGQLKSKDAVLHGMLKTWRDGFSSYASNAFKALIAGIRQQEDLQEGKERHRKANALFKEFYSKTLDTLKTRNKNARAKGDDTALPDEVVGKAINAFQLVVAGYYMTKKGDKQ